MERRKDNKGKILNKGESQRKDGTYMYRYYDIYKNRKTVYAPTLNELRRKEKEINRDIMDGIYTSESTVNQMFERYLEQNVNIKPRTKFKYKTEYERWISETWIGKSKINKLVKSDIVLFYKELSARGLSNGTIKCIHKYLNGVFEMAYDDDIIRKNFVKKCIDPYKKANHRNALTKKETDIFLTACENNKNGHNYLLGFKLMLLTGLRVGEMSGLTWKDIDLKNRIITVDHQFILGDEKSRTAYHIDVTKTSNGKRKVPMSDDVYELLRELKETTYFDSLKFGSCVDGYKGFVLHTRSGLPILTARFNEYAHRIVNEYNSNHDEKLPNITCHICRHTFCTRMAELNINPNALIKIVGHSSYKTTENIYISVEDDFVNEEFFRVMRGVS